VKISKKKTQDITPVIFRFWEKEGNQVIALFPTEPADERGSTVNSYMQTGQHAGAALFQMIQRTRPATPTEYRDLKKELERLGYKLKVYQRATRGMREELTKEVRRLNAPLKKARR
jgi:hypothetical protein